YYSARLQLGTNQYHYSYQVRDFQPSAFEVTLPTQPSYAAGEAVCLPLSAHYLFGKALTRAQVKWSLRAWDQAIRPPKYDAFTFCRGAGEAQYGRSEAELDLTGEGILGGGSNLMICPEIIANPVAPQPRGVAVLAEVTDLNQQTITRRAEFVWHSSDFYLGLHQQAEVLFSNTPPAIEILALGANGLPWTNNVTAHLRLQRVNWQSIRIQGAGRTVRYRSEAVYTNILERDITVTPVPAPAPDADTAQGNLIPELPVLAAGEYLLELKTQDAAGRPVVTSLSLSVSAPGTTLWRYRNDTELGLKPGQNEYAPGETAEILVQAPFSGTALVTVERERVLRSFTVPVTAGAPSITVPILPGDVPNVFVTVTLVRGAEQSTHLARMPEYRFGSCDLTVQDPANRLTVAVEPAAAEVLPGAPVEVTATLTDHRQQTVAGAEVILYAVDDGILGLSGYELPAPYKLFYASRPLGVTTSISLPNLLTEDAEAMNFGNKGYLGGGGGGGERPRKNFLACAFWQATLKSDAAGQVHVRFPAPDSLTRYRIFAVAHTRDSHFGSGESAFRVSKPLIVEPALPAVATITDQLTARALVWNQTAQVVEVQVTLSLDDKARAADAAGKLEQTVTVAAHGSAVVEFPVIMQATGEARWNWRAHWVAAPGVPYTDAVQSSLTVGHLAPLLGEVDLSRLDLGETNLLAAANPQLLNGSGTITVRLANTRLNELGDSVAQLLHYPYGCAEQTGSSLLPWLLLPDLHGVLADELGDKTNEVAGAIRTGLARLYSMQTQSGGLGYWPRAKNPLLWASAYGGMVMTLAQQHGVVVDAEEYTSLMNYLSGQLRSMGPDRNDWSDLCLAVHALALAGRSEPAYHEKLYGYRAQMSTADRAMLALAIAESQGPAEMCAELLRVADGQPGNDGWFGCPARTKAVQLLAWIHYRPHDPTVDRLVEDLIHERKNGGWRTTQGNAWALWALSEYARIVEAGRPPVAGRLRCGEQTWSFQLDAQTNAYSVALDYTHLTAALLLANASTNRLYTTVMISARPPETPQPRWDRGIGLERRYERLDDENKPQPIEHLQVGQRVLVTLRVTLHAEASYLALDDALPGNLEAVNAAFRTQEDR
ncbi:MAG TPA: alpha-2-macroglobulin family protein, partial [Verrucomicrobiae bacterium]